MRDKLELNTGWEDGFPNGNYRKAMSIEGYESQCMLAVGIGICEIPEWWFDEIRKRYDAYPELVARCERLESELATMRASQQ